MVEIRRPNDLQGWSPFCLASTHGQSGKDQEGIPMSPMLQKVGLLALVLASGCRHTGGKCDCVPTPGDLSGGPAYHSVAPSITTAPVAMPAATAEQLTQPRAMPK